MKVVILAKIYQGGVTLVFPASLYEDGKNIEIETKNIRQKILINASDSFLF